MTSVNFGSISTQVPSCKVVPRQQKQCAQLQHVIHNTAQEIWQVTRHSLASLHEIMMYDRKWWPFLKRKFFIFGPTLLPWNSIGGQFLSALVESPLKRVRPDADDDSDIITIFVTNKDADTFLYLNSNKILSSLAVTFNIGVLKLCIHRRTLQQKYFSFGSIN